MPAGGGASDRDSLVVPLRDREGGDREGRDGEGEEGGGEHCWKVKGGGGWFTNKPRHTQSAAQSKTRRPLERNHTHVCWSGELQDRREDERERGEEG